MHANEVETKEKYKLREVQNQLQHIHSQTSLIRTPQRDRTKCPLYREFRIIEVAVRKG